MDLADLKPCERIIDILHPANGEEIGIKVNILSINDSKMNKIKKRIQTKKLEYERRNKSFNLEDIEENEMDLIITAITGWDWGTNLFHGVVPEFNENNVKDVLKELPWFKQQIVEAIGDEKSFFQV